MPPFPPAIRVAVRAPALPRAFLPGANTSAPNAVLAKRTPAFFVNEISAVTSQNASSVATQHGRYVVMDTFTPAA
jgi:hypothetical protein